MSLLLLFVIAPVISGVLLLLNYLLSPSNNNLMKMSPFECGFSSFSQTRSPFHIHFFLVCLLFLVFDIEIALVYPYIVSFYYLKSYGLIVIILFIVLLTVGFIFEIGKKALILRVDK
jgi:NADH-ubiquinone oxidoreductase chain 3